MAFRIYYFRFDKKINSTAHPPTDNLDTLTWYDDVVLKEGCSYLNPVFLLYKGTGYDPQDSNHYWNYLYCSKWYRWYYIDDIVYNEGFLELHCKEDVLASWKSQIGSASLYVLRASNASDGNIVDTLYPTKTDATFHRASNGGIFSGDGSVNLSDGIFMVGIISKLGNAGSIRYHAFDRAGLASLCNALMDDSLLTGGSNPIDLNDASLVLQKSLMNPLQYVVSCIWLPISMSDFWGTSTSSCSVWDWTVTISNGNHKDGVVVPIITYSKSISLHKHPQASSRGAYLNTAPYTQYWLDFPPFGSIELDTTLLRDSSSLTIEVILDVYTGGGSMILSNGTVKFNRIDTQVGVPIQLSQVIKDYLSTAQTGVNAIGDIIGSMVTGNFGGAIMSGVNGIADATRAIQPKVSSVGSSGSFNSLYGIPYINAQHFPIVDGYNAELGRPYCKTATPSSLGGYLKCLGDVPIYGTTQEHDEIQEFITNGFYYE